MLYRVTYEFDGKVRHANIESETCDGDDVEAGVEEDLVDHLLLELCVDEYKLDTLRLVSFVNDVTCWNCKRTWKLSTDNPAMVCPSCGAFHEDD